MVNKEKIKKYIVEFENRDFSYVEERELKINLMRNKSVALIGPRRSGKTHYLYYLMKNKAHTLYIDFEHPLFYNIQSQDIEEIIQAYYELYPEKSSELYILLDEIQMVSEWERIIRYLIDKGHYVIFTGSSSKILVEDIAYHLRGRTLTYTLFPLSFKEMLKFKGINYRDAELYKNLEKIKHTVEEYLKYGGYPEVILYHDKERILKEYLETIIRRDLIDRYNIRNKSLINEIIAYSLNSYGRYISIDSLYKLFKRKMDVSKRTIAEYLRYFEDSFIFLLLSRYTPSPKERIVSQKKIYLIDTGLGIFGNKAVYNDMENVVFIELLRRKNYYNIMQEIYYYKTKDGYEVDFLIKESKEIKELIQVTYANTYEEIREREIRALLHAKEDLGLGDDVPLTVITWDYEDEKEVEWWRKKGKIRFVPLWKWLLEVK